MKPCRARETRDPTEDRHPAKWVCRIGRGVGRRGRARGGGGLHLGIRDGRLPNGDSRTLKRNRSQNKA